MGKYSCSKPKPCECHNPQPIPHECACSGWSELRPITPKDEEIFAIAIKSYCGGEFLPLAVSTQICNGYNFIFLAEKIIPGSCHPPTLVYVKIILSHCGKIRLLSIQSAHIFPEVRDDCGHCHLDCGCNGNVPYDFWGPPF